MPKIYIDNKEYDVKNGENLLEAILSLGLDLPYFCWHPQLGSVGACRQCAVKQFKDENDKKGKILISLHGACQRWDEIIPEGYGSRRIQIRDH